MKASEIRKKYLEFFKGKGHTVIPSASLVPENDPTTLFTGSGMQPLVPYLLGEVHPLGSRLVNSQKSFRAVDIEEVGDNRHTTFFEMLGNWSLGSYFKREQLQWFFEFLTTVVGLDAQKLYVSVFAGDPENNIPKDTESVEIWKKIFANVGIEAKAVEMGNTKNASEKGMQDGRIFSYDASKNWWSRVGLPIDMPPGEPGGPDSEVFYDFGTPHDESFGKRCHPNCDCGRFMEIGNSVFMEYKKNELGKFELLIQKNVDFGGGLERITAASNNDSDIFKIDLFSKSIEVIEKLSTREYDGELSKSFRVIADHVKAATFLIADGVLPSNKERGYILRRLIRRAVRHGQILGIEQEFCTEVATVVIHEYAGVYPDLAKHQEKIIDEIGKEDLRFRKTLAKGLREFEKMKEINGKAVFDLFQTYGFPLELTEELTRERGIKIDKQEFESEFKKHQELSRTSTAGVFKGGLADHSERTTRLHTATHLLQAGLRHVLGEHLFQRGSHITAERTRFDFNHPQKVTDEELRKVEEWVNEQVKRDLPMKPEWMTPKEAHDLGAIGLFDEKYEDKVSIYTIHDPKTGEIVSREFCGGPHVEHTGLVGKFKIQKEEAVAAGIRRIKATVE